MDYSLEFFLGKIVTILTSRTSRDFGSDKIGITHFSNYFTGRVGQIDSTGIWIIQERTGNVSYFAWNWIVGVCEELVVDESHPTVQKALERVEKEREAKAKEQEEMAAFRRAQEAMMQQPDLTELSVEKLGQVIKEKKR